MQSGKSLPECPHLNSALNANGAPVSPGDVLPVMSKSHEDVSPATLSQLQSGWSNLYGLLHKGPHGFFSETNALAQQSFYKVRVGTKDVYQVTDGEIAKALLTKKEYASNLGRGSLLVPFKSMVGDVFFANDDEKAVATRKVFYKTISRAKDNFVRINQVNERTFAAIELSSGKVNDLFAFVAYHTMGCIAKCFVGADDLSAIPSDTHITFLDATRQIAKASMDPLSRIIHPYVHAEFRAASYAMAQIASDLLEKNIDTICRGNNYTWDLAVFRAKELHPDMSFDNCSHYDEADEQSTIVRNLIVTKDKFVLEHGPLTIFASSNVGATLYFLIDTLSRRPDVIKKLCDEIRGIRGEQPLTFEQSKKLSYVHAVVQEALWQATPIPSFPREVLSSFEMDINGKTVAFLKGDTLMFHFRPMQETTGEFNPERWLGGDESPAPHLYAFGAGLRKCPAELFAKQLLAQFLVGMVSRNLYLEPATRTKYTTQNGTLGPDYHPEHPVTAEVKLISPAFGNIPDSQKLRM